MTKSNANSKENYKDTVGNNLMVLRRSSGMSAKDFSKLIGISRPQLYRIESGEALFLPIRALLRINKLISLDLLFTKKIDAAFFKKELARSGENV